MLERLILLGGPLGNVLTSKARNLLFLAGLAWLIYGALFFDYPDWDIGVSLLMAGSTYLFAAWCWRALVRMEWRQWPAAVVAAWWCVDGSYWAYWSLVNPAVMIRDGQWPMSLCLFLLCGFVLGTSAPPYHVDVQQRKSRIGH